MVTGPGGGLEPTVTSPAQAKRRARKRKRAPTSSLPVPPQSTTPQAYAISEAYAAAWSSYTSTTAQPLRAGEGVPQMPAVPPEGKENSKVRRKAQKKKKSHQRRRLKRIEERAAANLKDAETRAAGGSAVEHGIHESFGPTPTPFDNDSEAEATMTDGDFDAAEA